jgi:4,5-DOPA dioxygenase extradiol
MTMACRAPSAPALFVGHGSPMHAIERSRYADGWRALGMSLPRPRAILAVSAHWYTRGAAVTAMARPRTIHDFGGFPRELYEVEYPAPGDRALAERVRELLKPDEVRLDETWGLDHGSWSVLRRMYPRANVPVVQLSIDGRQPPQVHYEMAARLAPLRDDGVLILGSGNVVHNLGEIQWSDDAPPRDWAERFNDRVRVAVLASDHRALIELPTADDDARRSIPTPDHYLPLIYVIAQRRDGDAVTIPLDGIEYGSISMLCAQIGPAPA